MKNEVRILGNGVGILENGVGILEFVVRIHDNLVRIWGNMVGIPSILSVESILLRKSSKNMGGAVTILISL